MLRVMPTRQHVQRLALKALGVVLAGPAAGCDVHAATGAARHVTETFGLSRQGCGREAGGKHGAVLHGLIDVHECSRTRLRVNV